MQAPTAKSITYDQFKHILDGYNDFIYSISKAPEDSGAATPAMTHVNLEGYRTAYLPDAVAERKTTTGRAWIDNSELINLVKYKL
jgi:hypothetical protein